MVNRVLHKQSFGIASVLIATSMYWISLGLQVNTFWDLINATISYWWSNDELWPTLQSRLRSPPLHILHRYGFTQHFYLLDRPGGYIEYFLGP